MNIIFIMREIIFIIVQTVIELQVLVIKHFAINGVIKGYIVNLLEEKNITFL